MAVISHVDCITTCMWLSLLMSIIQPLACGCHFSCRLYNYLHVAVTSYVNCLTTCLWLSLLTSIIQPPACDCHAVSCITTCMGLSLRMSIIEPLACGCHLSCLLYNYLHVAVIWNSQYYKCWNGVWTNIWIWSNVYKLFFSNFSIKTSTWF